MKPPVPPFSQPTTTGPAKPPQLPMELISASPAAAIARHLEQDVADEEDAGAEAEHLRREAEILVHGQRGKADIDPVEEIHRIADTKEGDQAAGGLAQGGSLVIIHAPHWRSLNRPRRDGQQKPARPK